MSDATPDLQCERNTKTGSRCSRTRVMWPIGAALPNPASCFQHLTVEERAIDVTQRQWWAAECDRTWLPHLTFRAFGDPACWTWPAPDEARLREMTPGDRAAAMYAWHQGRCAICGGPEQVTDHDHATAMVRGRLCQGCNVGEGYGNGGIRNIFDKYREQNPASIWDVREIYYNSFGGQYAEPLPNHEDADRWEYDALDGIL